MTTKSRITTGSAAVLLGASLLLGACGSEESTTEATTTTVAAATSSTEAPDTTAPAGELTVDGAWARTSPSATTKGAVYLQITNGTDTDDALVKAAVDPSVAAMVEIHETKAAEEGGMMQMAPVDEIPVPAGEIVSLEPGGYHIMLMDLAAPLETGATIEVTLTFEGAGEVVVEAEVRDTAP